MRQQPVLETAVVGRIIKALRSHPDIVVRKRHGTAMGVAGDPDLYGTMNGRHSELQTRRLLEWRLAGAITGAVRSVDEALHMMHKRFGDLNLLEEIFWQTHPDLLLPRTARKPNADQQEEDVGDDPDVEQWPGHVL